MISEKQSIKILLLCLPDISKPIGGVKQLYKHAEILDELGYNAYVVTEKKAFRPKWFESKAKTVEVEEARTNEEYSAEKCILVLPETYNGVNQANLFEWDIREHKKVIFNQNAYYTFGAENSEDTKEFYEDKNVLQVLSISEDTHSFLKNSLGIEDHKISRIINSVEEYFQPSEEKENIIHWMPRKNPDHSAAVINSLKMQRINNAGNWSASPLVSMSHKEIAAKLNKSLIFLSFGNPEGFGLPVAEAMAAGNMVIGYSGQGAKELFRYGYGNTIEFGDWTSFTQEIVKIMNEFETCPREMEMKLERQSISIKNLYSSSQEKRSIERAWIRIVQETKR